MNIFKFGGASVNSAEGVRNLMKISQAYKDETIIVVSAMGKMTNLLENLADAFFYGKEEIDSLFQQIKEFHLGILSDLFPDSSQSVYKQVDELFNDLAIYLKRTPSLNYDFEYDQIVVFGELLSTTIVSQFLNKSGKPNKWVDIRNSLKTDHTYREASVDWELSHQLVNQNFSFDNTFVYVTQGFIGATNTNLSTTLGREGSDYSAAILAYILDAEAIIIWKDVPGIMNADPKWLSDSQKLERISYQEAIELAFYGAKVIHPKTIQPLKNKKIPLMVKSFMAPQDPGTTISCADNKKELKTPVFIQKKKQWLISILPNDFSFIMEDNLSDIFAMFARYRVKINLTQNSAISFSVCVDHYGDNLLSLIDELSENYKVRYNQNLELVTIRHYTAEAVQRIIDGRKVMMEQRSRNTAQFVLGN